MRTNRTLVGVVAAVLVAGLVIAGLFAIGSPATARKFKADQRRVERLQDLHRSLLNHFGDEGELPESLADLEPAFWENYGMPNDPRRDPMTGELFEYRLSSGRQYEVCAVFETASNDPRNPTQRYREIPRPLEPDGFEGFYSYERGRNCFDRMITIAEIRSFYPEDAPFGDDGPPVQPPIVRFPPRD
jgi:hypothetical protein